MTEEYRAAKEVAREMGIDQRELRKFLRHADSPFEPVGQGARYMFDAEDVELLKESYAKHISGKKTRPRKKPTPAEEREAFVNPENADVDGGEDATDDPFEEPDLVSFEGLDEPDEGDLEEIEFDDEDWDEV